MTSGRVYLVQQNESTRGRRRVAIYCRVSTSDQDNDRRERDLLEYAERADFEVVEVFKETLSGIRKMKGSRSSASGLWRWPKGAGSTLCWSRR